MVLGSHVGTLTEVTSGRHWSEAEIHEQLAIRTHSYQSHGLGRGDRVLLLFGNRIEIFVEILAIWKLGGCVIPVDTRLTPFEIRKLAETADARFSVINNDTDASVVSELAGTVVLNTAEHRRATRANRPPSGQMRFDDDALILFTSGTTGEPKGVVHTNRSLQARWITLHQALGIQPYRRALCMLPTHFGHGLICNCLFPWLFGCDLFIAPPFRPETLMQLGALIDEHDITFMSSVPAMWNLALRTAKAPSKGTLQRIHIGSAPLSADIWRKVQDWAQTGSVINSYGITEVGSWVAGTTCCDAVPDDGLIGIPWGATIQVLRARSVEEASDGAGACAAEEPGMIWLNTPALMKGYFHRDDLTDAVVHQGWFMTGDIGVIDGQGRLQIRGRERDEINKGGMKVHPAEVEAVAQQSEFVSDVCAFGIDDELYGENVAIALVLENRKCVTIAGLHKWMSENLAEHKRPIRWYLLDEIPRTSRGKFNRDTTKRICDQHVPLDLSSALRSKKLS